MGDETMMLFVVPHKMDYVATDGNRISYINDTLYQHTYMVHTLDVGIQQEIPQQLAYCAHNNTVSRI